jgi:hypothetical protein
MIGHGPRETPAARGVFGRRPPGWPRIRSPAAGLAEDPLAGWPGWPRIRSPGSPGRRARRAAGLAEDPLAGRRAAGLAEDPLAGPQITGVFQFSPTTGGAAKSAAPPGRPHANAPHPLTGLGKKDRVRTRRQRARTRFS